LHLLRADYSFTNEKGFPPGDSILAKIMTTKEVSEYLKLHKITICIYTAWKDPGDSYRKGLQI
jgi:hypothetical protein